MLSHKNLVCNAYQSIATARITFADRMLVFLPLYHIYGIMYAVGLCCDDWRYDSIDGALRGR
jgi:long-subunit acyl-CoA synthetase (AMP-forming)